MRTTWRQALLGLGLLAAASLAGCTVHAQPGVEVEAAPAGYTEYPAPAYEPVYYDRGWYDGPNWVWIGPDHHRYWESREWHERRWHDRDYHEHEHHWH